MGYDSGTFERSRKSYAVHAFQVGKCRENDNWLSCGGGGNTYTADPAKTHRKDACAGGLEDVGLIITCLGDSGKTTSCAGNE